jgi:hypothetical protein
MAALLAPPDLDRRWVLRVPPDPYLRFDTATARWIPKLPAAIPRERAPRGRMLVRC